MIGASWTLLICLPACCDAHKYMTAGGWSCTHLFCDGDPDSARNAAKTPVAKWCVGSASSSIIHTHLPVDAAVHCRMARRCAMEIAALVGSYSALGRIFAVNGNSHSTVASTAAPSTKCGAASTCSACGSLPRLAKCARASCLQSAGSLRVVTTQQAMLDLSHASKYASPPGPSTRRVGSSLNMNPPSPAALDDDWAIVATDWLIEPTWLPCYARLCKYRPCYARNSYCV